MSDKRGFGVGFSKEVDAIMTVVQMGAQMGAIYVYPHEVRENLRLAGMKLDRNLQRLTPFPTYQAPEFPADYEADFEGEPQEEYEPSEYEVPIDEELPVLTEEEINAR